MTAAYRYKNRLQPWEFSKAYLRAVVKTMRGRDILDEIFLIIRSLNGPEVDRLIEGALEDPSARKVLDQRKSMLSVLGDWDLLESLPKGSLGHDLLDYFRRFGISNMQMAGASEEAMSGGFGSSDEEFLSLRVRDLHDLWHVLTGYPPDRLGENALLAFTYSNTGIRGFGVFAVLQMGVRFAKNLLLLETPDSIRIIQDAFRRGRQTPPLLMAEWEKLIALPTSEVRRILSVAPSGQEYHPFRFQQSQAAWSL